jgi:hypothetical protein
MKAFVLNDKEVLPVKSEKVQAGWNHLLKKLKGLSGEKFESDWEKQTGLPGREWHKWE